MNAPPEWTEEAFVLEGVDLKTRGLSSGGVQYGGKRLYENPFPGIG
jgi:hypothetical protein